MKRPPISLKARAIKYLSSREHSRLELARKLNPYAQDGDDIEALLNWLEQAKFLSAERFSESLVHRRAGRFGNHRIFSELQSHGMDAADYDDIKHTLIAGEAQRALAVLRKKYSVPPDSPEARIKYQRFLMQRGFSGQSISQAIKMMHCNDAFDENA
jgi:regulatory protein